MIDIKASSNQSVGVSTQKAAQEIQILNLPKQDIAISINENQNIDILNANPYQKVEVVPPWTTRAEAEGLRIAIDSKVPKALNILPQATSEQLKARSTSRIYIDINGEASFATLEQIKDLNTKTILVDELSDNKIGELSNEDIILLRM